MPSRWDKPNGYRQVLAVSLPLIASMGTITLMEFTDRVFLANYSLDAISAALPAGVCTFLFISFFMGVGDYTNTFVAQYIGAREKERVGASLWQGIYFSLFSSVILAGLYFIAPPLFNLIGHSPDIRNLEIVYFRILICGPTETPDPDTASLSLGTPSSSSASSLPFPAGLEPGAPRQKDIAARPG